VRADRLVATLMFLQRRTRVTAAEVAFELEVSERTARRDLEALAVAGVPVYSQPGRGGGWRLVGGARTDLSGLKEAEARALFLVAAPAVAATPALKSALSKLVQALPAPFRDQAEAAATSVIVDPDRWGQNRRWARPEHLEALQSAVIGGDAVRLGYAGRNGAPGTRVVHPLGLVTKNMVWYLIAGTDAGLRTFRVDRVTGVETTGEPVVRPPDFDLHREWERIVSRVDVLRSPARVEAVVEAGTVAVLRWVFGAQLTVGETTGDGRVTVTLAGQDIEIIAAQLAGFGHQVEVTGPPSARRYLARVGEELRHLYAAEGRPDPVG
jgi:predicted DNA-binding transcriptional regulator YafY